MNKYEEYFKTNELDSVEKNKKINELLCLEYYKFIRNMYGQETYNNVHRKLGYNLVLEHVLTFSQLDNIYKNWIIENALPHINKESLMSLFLNFLTDSIPHNNTSLRKTLISSMKEIGLVKEIFYENGIFILITNEGKYVKFKNISDNVKDIEEYKNNCHHLSYELALYKTNKDIRTKTKIITILEKGYFDFFRYHSFIIRDGIVHDFARNLIISIEDYKKIFNPKIIVEKSAIDIINDIDTLEQKDKEFRDANLYKVLKYAIYKEDNIV